MPELQPHLLENSPDSNMSEANLRPPRRLFHKGLAWPFCITAEGNRIYGLDILRAAAILFVLIAHGDNLHSNETVKRITGWIGFDGVSLFFVLSGFLIGGILLKVMEKGEHTPKVLFSFWQRRWLRTLPAYYLVLTTLILLETFIGHTPMLQHSKRFYIFLQNFNIEHTVFFQEAWSLSVEEWFYLLVPAALFLLTGFLKLPSEKSILFAAVMILLFSIGFRYYRYTHLTITSFEEWDQIYRKQVVTRLDSLMFGVTGAYLVGYHKELWVKYKKACLFTGLALMIFLKLYGQILAPSYGLYQCVMSFDLEALMVLLFLPQLSQMKKGRGIVYRMVTHISLISYSLYLINFSLVQGWLLPHKPIWGLSKTSFESLRYLCFWLITIGGATLLYKYVERPVMRLRH